MLGHELVHAGLVDTRTDRGLFLTISHHLRERERTRRQEQQGDAEESALPRVDGQVEDPDDRSAQADAEGDRGLFFIFISARAYDTIEFLQQEWINRGNFIDLGTERDPIVALHEEPGTFTIPQEQARRRVNGVTTFNRLMGGEYLFMPSLTALRWIGEAGWR